MKKKIHLDWGVAQKILTKEYFVELRTRYESFGFNDERMIKFLEDKRKNNVKLFQESRKINRSGKRCRKTKKSIEGDRNINQSLFG